MRPQEWWLPARGDRHSIKGTDRCQQARWSQGGGTFRDGEGGTTTRLEQAGAQQALRSTNPVIIYLTFLDAEEAPPVEDISRWDGHLEEGETVGSLGSVRQWAAVSGFVIL